jgi:hypothetical protein
MDEERCDEQINHALVAEHCKQNNRKKREYRDDVLYLSDSFGKNSEWHHKGKAQNDDPLVLERKTCSYLFDRNVQEGILLLLC